MFIRLWLLDGSYPAPPAPVTPPPHAPDGLAAVPRAGGIVRRIHPLLPALAVAALLANAVLAQEEAESLSAELEGVRQRYNLPGLAALAVKDGRIVGQGAAGVRRAGDPTALDVDDPVNLGSCTKWLTATLAGRLVDRGVVSWSTRVRDVFPGWARFHAAYHDVSLEELLAHRGGVPEGTVWEPRYRPELFRRSGTVTELRRWVAEVTLADPPQVARGTELYSNQGYAVAAAILELLTGRSWEELMAEEVFRPLGMASARVGSSYASLNPPAAAVVGHDQTDPLATPVPRPPLVGLDLTRYQAMAGPGGLVVCTLRDWARFLHRHAIDGAGYLSAESARKLRTPFAGAEGYALGVGVLSRAFAAPGMALNHTGDILGQTTLFWLAPEHDLILLAYTNTAARGSASAEGRNATASLLLSRYRDAPPRGPLLDATAPTIPAIVVPPAAIAARAGESATFSVDVDGVGPFSFQWRFNDVPIAGATASRLALAEVGGHHAGFYSVDVRNAVGSTASPAAVLTLIGGTEPNRLGNLSVLAPLAPAQVLRVGFSLAGGSRPVLLRAVGAGLRAFGVADCLADPAVLLHAASGEGGENDDWTAGPAVHAATASVGAFALPGNSPDSVLLRTLTGANSMAVGASRKAVGGGSASGQVLVEVYDAGSGGAGRLANLSVLHELGAAATLTAGFSITGSGRRRLLIRAVGPALAALGVDGVMANPRLALFDAEGRRVGENDDWDLRLAAAFSAVGAFLLPPASRDAAVEVELPAGGYTVQTRGDDGGGGMVLLEVYDRP